MNRDDWLGGLIAFVAVVIILLSLPWLVGYFCCYGNFVLDFINN
jgi:hypothetical protein